MEDIMLAIYLSPIYILVHAYSLYWILKWMSSWGKFFRKKRFRIIVGAIYTLLAVSMLIGFFLPHGRYERLFKIIGYYWSGISLYEIIALMIALLIRFIILHTRFATREIWGRRRTLFFSGLISATLALSVCLYGVVNAHHIRTTNYEVSINKKAGHLKDLNICLIADLHMGYNIGVEHITQMVDKINATKPDLVVIAGDIFDNEYDALDHPDELIKQFKRIKSKYGVFAVYGNHDIEEHILAGFTFGEGKQEADPRMDQFLKKANIKNLRDESVVIDNSFTLYGRPDYNKPGKGIKQRKTPSECTQSLDHSKPIIMIDHEPKELEEKSKAGVDLDLGGHTHDGQAFPANIITNIVWENACGHIKKGHMHSIVTSGVGIFGPFMRVATKAEICSIKVHFK
jgi:predicted MPP superfamily phosphohydrolase